MCASCGCALECIVYWFLVPHPIYSCSGSARMASSGGGERSSNWVVVSACLADSPDLADAKQHLESRLPLLQSRRESPIPAILCSALSCAVLCSGIASVASVNLYSAQRQSMVGSVEQHWRAQCSELMCADVMSDRPVVPSVPVLPVVSLRASAVGARQPYEP